MSDKKYLKTESRKDYHQSTPITNADLQSGALMRMADALEIIAKDKADLEGNLLYYRRQTESFREENKNLLLTIRGLRGTVTKLKNKLNLKEDTSSPADNTPTDQSNH